MYRFRFRCSVITGLIALSTFTTSCSWVDSTGQNGSGGNPTTVDLFNARSIELLENVNTTGTLVGVGESLNNWQWQLDSRDVRESCTQHSGFDLTHATADLALACSAEDCSLDIAETTRNNRTHFSFRMPALKAPVALAYTLKAIRFDGAVVSREQIFCGLSINEAPDANDDQYTAVLGELRQVSGDDADNLLSNDFDDVDIRNQPLKVLTTPIQVPRYANRFTLHENGGFAYQTDVNLSTQDESELVDSFIYAVTDGIHTSQAEVTLTLSTQNTPPNQVNNISDADIVLMSRADEQTITLNLLEHFNDSDGDKLVFSNINLPDQLEDKVKLSSIGELSITGAYNDLGYWVIPFTVSDGLHLIQSQIGITIRLGSGIHLTNRPPEVDDINNQLVQNRFDYDVSLFFTDPDGDPLTYSATGLPQGVSISKTGIISGTASPSNQGRWFVVVTATDPQGLTSKDGFRLVIN